MEGGGRDVLTLRPIDICYASHTNTTRKVNDGVRGGGGGGYGGGPGVGERTID